MDEYPERAECEFDINDTRPIDLWSDCYAKTI